jgi:phage tail sheath protein FI
MSSDPLWKYVNVRRLFIFLEASIYNSTQWVVFEPNDQRLWARVKQTVTLFLRTQWREGALLGSKEEDAFSVAVGRETMTEEDILNGRLIIEVGVAPVRPAEFVVFRIFQKTQEAKS